MINTNLLQYLSRSAFLSCAETLFMQQTRVRDSGPICTLHTLFENITWGLHIELVLCRYDCLDLSPVDSYMLGVAKNVEVFFSFGEYVIYF